MAFKERTTTQDYLKSTYFGGWPNLFILADHRKRQEKYDLKQRRI